MFPWLSRSSNLQALDRLKKYNLAPAQVAQFKNFVRAAEPPALYRLNPRYLANRLGWELMPTLDVLTYAAVENLWHLEWDTFCPGCGYLLQNTPELGQIESHQVCPMCSWQGEIIIDQMVTVSASLDETVRKLNPAQRDQPDFRKQADLESGQVLALQLVNRPLFREMLGDQVLPHNQSLGVQHLAVFFSDLKGSTALYQRLGDAAAYQLVRQHFIAIFEAVEAHGGSAVKTIGDGIMGTFLSNANALQGIIASMRAIQALNEFAGLSGEDHLRLKVGLHAGPCIVVTLNHRLDYFGSTVNIAARLSNLSEGDDLLLSDAILHDPQAASLVSAFGQSESLTTTLRGLTTPIDIHRIRFS